MPKTTPNSSPGDSTLHRLFEKSAGKYPTRTALVYGEERVDYADLNARANRVARVLQGLDVRPGTPVGLYLTRSVELYVLMLAVLKVGACVVPLNPAHPDAMVGRIVEEAGVSTVVHQGGWDAAGFGRHLRALSAADLSERAQSCEDGDPDADVAVDVEGESTAFVMFTSGSTGTPKGVRIAHRGLARLAVHSPELDITERDCFLQHAAFSFAASTIEIWQSLLHGATLVVLPPKVPTLPELREVIERHQVTFLSLPCGLFNLLVDHEIGSLRALRVITLSGDFPSPDHLTRAVAATPAKIFNCYGCTEGSSLVALYPVHSAGSLSRTEPVPVGRPMPLMTAEVLDDRLEPCVPGEVGELCVGGAGVAQGYVHDEALTARKFVRSPTNGAVLYRTGDLARTTAQGDIVLAGRADGMVKIRGFRVEPSAVELALKAHDAVDQAVVKAFGNEVAQKSLVAFFTTRPGRRPDPAELRAHLGDLVPDYMIPAGFHRLEELPVNVNGKIDRSLLKAPELETPETVARHREGDTDMNSPLEAAVLQTWKDIIGVDDCSTSVAFLENGGNSLHFVQLAGNLKKVFGIDIGVEEVFRYGNVEKLARHIEEKRNVTC